MTILVTEGSPRKHVNISNKAFKHKFIIQLFRGAFRREYLNFYKISCILRQLPFYKKPETMVSVLRTESKDIRPRSRWSNSSIAVSE